MNLQPGEEPPQSPPKAASEEKQANGIPPPAQFDPISPFSQPPAPPPQQPLPEKPDSARLSNPDISAQPPFKRTDTERPRSGLSSPNRAESGQIISLVEALKIKTHELDSKADYIRSLEVDLARERRARESAERRALKLSGVHSDSDDNHDDGLVDEGAFEPPLDSIEMMGHNMPNGHVGHKDDESNLSRSSSMSTIKDAEDTSQPTEDTSSLASRLQAQLDLRNKEMTEMKQLMESYSQRAEEAEEGRRSLAEMVENIRAGRDPKSPIAATSDDFSPRPLNKDDSKTIQVAKPTESTDLDCTSPSPQRPHHQQNGSATIGTIHQEIEKTMSSVLQQQQRQWHGGPGERGRMVQSAPYVSMVGVVLIGVGIMTWLNGWQPGGEK